MKEMENLLLPLTLAWCVTSGTSLCLSVYWFPQLKHESNDTLLLCVSTLKLHYEKVRYRRVRWFQPLQD